MNIFLDSADITEIKKWHTRGVLDGVTTNPTLLSHIEADPGSTVRAIAQAIAPAVVSIEVTQTDPRSVEEQAHRIAAIGSNVLVKIPCLPDYYELIHRLVSAGIKINITLVFSLVQAVMMAKLGVAYISPFVGRLIDMGIDGVQLVKDIRRMLDYYQFSTKICAASIRTEEQCNAVILAGAHTVTVPPMLLDQMVRHPLTDKGMQKFMSDWREKEGGVFP